MQIIISNITQHLFFSDFLLGVLTGILYFPITYLCLASHATPLLHRMISLFMHVHESQFIQVYFLSLLKLHQMKKNGQFSLLLPSLYKSEKCFH